jgi:hypothetical protein
MLFIVASYPGVTVWTLLRRPLLLLLVLGCFVSIQASGRFSIRLIVDGAASFAFLPVFEIASLALVAGARERRVSFGEAVDRFFASDSAWLMWAVAIMAIRAVASPQLATAPPRLLFWTIAASTLPVAIWTVRLDLRLFQSTVAPARPIRALVLQRLIAWTGALTYFFGIAAWATALSLGRR